MSNEYDNNNKLEPGVGVVEKKNEGEKEKKACNENVIQQTKWERQPISVAD